MNIIRDDDRYVVADHVRDNWTFSVTILYPDKETTGHKHNFEEQCSFLSGYGELVLNGDEILTVGKDVTLWIQPNHHHQVRNLSKLEPLIFTCIWKGSRP